MTTATADEAVRAIRRYPKLVEECQAVAPRLAERCRPMETRTEVLEHLLPFVVVYGLRDRPKAAWTKFWDAYIDALLPLPSEALAEAVVQWNQHGEAFMPKPNQLFKLALPRATEMRVAAWRAKKACEAEAAHPIQHKRELTPEEVAERKRLTASMFNTDAEGRVIGLKKPDGAQPGRGPAPGMDPPPARPLHERQAEAERLRAYADAQEAKPLTPPDDEPEEAI